MAITLSIHDLFYIFYLLFEQYLVERTFTGKPLVISKKQKRRNSYFEMVEKLEVDYCSFEQEGNLLVPSTNSIAKPEVSKLDDGAMELLKNLEKEFTDSRVVPSFDDSYFNYSDKDIPPVALETDIYISDDDCLSIHDINLDESIYDEESNRSLYPQYESTSIRDNVMGYQQWIVTVIGKEGPYLHISDGEKLWVKVTEREAAQTYNRDVLLLEIYRTDESVQVERMETLETISKDYEIPEEIELYVQPVAV